MSMCLLPVAPIVPMHTNKRVLRVTCTRAVCLSYVKCVVEHTVVGAAVPQARSDLSSESASKSSAALQVEDQTVYVELRDSKSGHVLARHDVNLSNFDPHVYTQRLSFTLTPSASTTCTLIANGSNPLIDCGPAHVGQLLRPASPIQHFICLWFHFRSRL
jgi:predicted aspartyl protease